MDGRNSVDSTRHYLKQIAELNKNSGELSFSVDELLSDSLQNILRTKISRIKENKVKELEFLKSVDEPDLTGDSIEYDCFRLTKKPGWFGSNFIIKIEKWDDQIDLTVKKIKDVYGGRGNDSVIYEKYTKSISKKEWLDLSGSIARTYFWTINTDSDRYGCSDCDIWLLEGEQQVFDAKSQVFYNRYHQVKVWGSMKASSLGNIFEYLIKLTGEDLNKYKSSIPIY